MPGTWHDALSAGSQMPCTMPLVHGPRCYARIHEGYKWLIPCTRNQVPYTWHHAFWMPGTRHFGFWMPGGLQGLKRTQFPEKVDSRLALGAWCQVIGSKFLVPGAWDYVQSALSLKTGGSITVFDQFGVISCCFY